MFFYIQIIYHFLSFVNLFLIVLFIIMIVSFYRSVLTLLKPMALNFSKYVF